MDQTDNRKADFTFAEYQEKLRKDLEEAELAVEKICSWIGWPEKIDKEKEEQLQMLIDRNNKGELGEEAIIGFLTELYVFHDWRFEDPNSSWDSSLNYVHKASKNPQLIGLVDELFNPNEGTGLTIDMS